MTEMTNLGNRLRNWFQLLGKYGLSSLLATGFDFMAFHVALTWLVLSAVEATVVGRSVGAAVAFWLQRRWVFQQVRATRGWVLIVKYLAGVLLGMGLNVGGVWLLHNLVGWSPWPARIVSALVGWFLIFLFNTYIVFNLPANRRPINYRT
jgi:putative flippase GtrA